MIPHKMTITEAKKIDLVNHLASLGWQSKKVSVIFSFHQQPSTSYVKETPKILIKEVRELQSDRLKNYLESRCISFETARHTGF
jgi:hypothetical protein